MGTWFSGARKDPVVVWMALSALLQEFEHFRTYRAPDARVDLVHASKLSKPDGLPRKRRQVRSRSGQEELFVLVAQRCEPSFD
jgi:hypothetical protein